LGIFGRYTTNLRGTFVENVKKVENQLTLLYTTMEKIALKILLSAGHQPSVKVLAKF
jgi:hypothetical protein